MLLRTLSVLLVLFGLVTLVSLQVVVLKVLTLEITLVFLSGSSVLQEFNGSSTDVKPIRAVQLAPTSATVSASPRNLATTVKFGQTLCSSASVLSILSGMDKNVSSVNMVNVMRPTKVATVLQALSLMETSADPSR